jgi:hypothetical protein
MIGLRNATVASAFSAKKMSLLAAAHRPVRWRKVMMLHRSIRLGALATATLVSLSPGFANAAEQHRPHHHHYYHHHYYYAHAPYGYYGYTSYPAQAHYACHKWCDADFSPCDPLYFKIADGRCDSNPF